ncbi:MAG: penicillin-binding protein activator [Burkholderiales bacterium]|jgi:outer membrane PBP1 activator LpoA protein
MPSRRAVVLSGVIGGLAAPLWASAQGRANEAPPAEPGSPRPRTRFGQGPQTIALLLPRQDGPFARAAQSLLAGVKAAHGRDGAGVVVEAIELDDQADELASTFAELAERNVALVLGPVTRNGANALVDLGPLGVPTLALNVPDGNAPVSSRLTFFGLPIESEARQVAGLAFAQALPRAGTRRPRAGAVTVASPLARRGAQSFRDAWLALGGEMREIVEFQGPRPSRDLRARLGTPAPDVVFLAMGAEQARVLRGTLGSDTAVWSTSLASIGNTAQLRLPELDGMRVLEMPWLLEPDSPAVMAYAKVPAGFNVEMQRLYALGIDAFRVGRLLLAGDTAFELDGVTGKLRYERAAGPRVERLALPAEYRNGMPVASAAP